MEKTSNNKVMGIEIGKYVNLCYITILISAGYGLLGNFAGLGGVAIPGGLIFSLLGLVGLILTLLALFVFKDKFSGLDMSHFKYIGIIFAAFLVLGIVLGGTLFKMGFVGLLLIIVISAVQFALFFAGYRTYKAGIEATKDTIIGNLKSGFKG